MHSLSSPARSTIIMSWLFVGLASLFITTIPVTQKLRRMRIRFPDACICAALVIGTLLVNHTTWAIVDQGGVERQRNLSDCTITMIAKVCTLIFDKGAKFRVRNIKYTLLVIRDFMIRRNHIFCWRQGLGFSVLRVQPCAKR